MSIYRPLSPDKREFRILHVDISGPYEQGRIRCRLERASFIGSVPAYEAISWCWGDTSQKSSIMIDGRVVEITESAEVTLQWICFHHRHAAVWLDAVCIDQQNLLERAAQVAMMQDIYSRANGVLVWLGIDQLREGPKRDINQIENLCRECYEYAATEDLATTFWSPNGDLRYMEGETKSRYQNSKLLVPHIYTKPWFTRLWVVQEVMLNANVTCYFGIGSISWTKLSLAAQWLWFRQYREARVGQKHSPGVEFASQIWRYTYKEYDYMDLLGMSIRLRSSKPIDKIYGIYGLLHTANMLCQSDVELKPVYSTNFVDVYIRATRAALARRSGRSDQLNILLCSQTLVVPPAPGPPSGASSTNYTRPSWVPRYDWIFDAELGSALGLRPFGVGAANGICTTIAMNCPNPRILSLSGFVVDKVAQLGGHFPWRLHDDNRRFQEVIQSCFDIASNAGHDLNNTVTTLICGQTGLLPLLDHDDSIQAYFDYLRTVFGRQFVSVLRSGLKKAMRTPSCNGRFFVTSKGMIGMGTPNIQTGDVVCILFGGVLPFVLRPSSHHWNVVGNAYVHGIMDGSYVRDLEAEGRLAKETQTFEIH